MTDKWMIDGSELLKFLEKRETHWAIASMRTSDPEVLKAAAPRTFDEVKMIKGLVLDMIKQG